VKELRKGLQQGASLAWAAIKAGMDRKTARKYRVLGQLPSETRKLRTWRTRADPLLDVWPRLEELLHREPGLQAKTLLGWLQQEYPQQDWQQEKGSGVFSDPQNRKRLPTLFFFRGWGIPCRCLPPSFNRAAESPHRPIS
jgi:hypothetical protein